MMKFCQKKKFAYDVHNIPYIFEIILNIVLMSHKMMVYAKMIKYQKKQDSTTLV